MDQNNGLKIYNYDNRTDSQTTIYIISYHDNTNTEQVSIVVISGMNSNFQM